MATIIINYNSKWGNAFNEEVNDKLEVIGNKKMNSPENKNNALDYYKRRDVDFNTVYGLLYRLLGARLPLKEILKNDDKSILSSFIKEEKIKFSNQVTFENEESVFLRNKNHTDDPSGYSGVLNSEIFDYEIDQVIDTLFYSREELLKYLTNNVVAKIDRPTIGLLQISKMLKEMKDFKDEKSDKESGNFKYLIRESEYKFVNDAYKEIFNTEVSQEAILHFLAINKAMKIAYDKNKKLSIFLSSANTLSGIGLSGKSFTQKDFLSKFAQKKKSLGNVYKADFYILDKISNKNYKANKALTKSSGVLTIEIDCDYDSGLEFKKLIDNAGVSSFSVGKKGLAYIDKIII